MKKVLILSVLFFSLNQSYAQKIRFNDTTNMWISCSSDPFTWIVDGNGNIIKPSTAKRIKNDTLLNGHTYYYHCRYNAWIREDSAGRKCYYWQLTDTTEQIFVDFTMQAGDTLKFLGVPTVLKTVDSVLINGVYHIVQDFGFQAIMEGIGPKYSAVVGLETPYHPICCFETGGQRPVLPAQQVWFDNVSSCVTSVKNIVTTKQAGILPNPLTPNSRIILPQLAEIAKLRIINTAGQRVVDETFKHVREIPVGGYGLPAGIYFFTVKDAAMRETYKGKFVVQ